MSRLARPLNHGAVQEADRDLYQRHQDDPRPNALYDASGNQRPLDATDPQQADLRAEWRGLYNAALKSKDDPKPPHGLVHSQRPVSNPVQACSLSSWTPKTAKVAAPSVPRTIPPKPGEEPETHWIEIKLTAMPDQGPRPDYWEPRVDDCYSAELFSADITSGPDKGSLDGAGSVRYENIPAGTCRFDFHDFHKEIERYFDEQLS